MEPFHESFYLQRGAAWYKQTARFNQHHCLRQLALIEFPDKRLEYSPLDHAALVQAILERRQEDTCESKLLSEVQEAAARRLLEYGRDDARGCANARFLNLTVENIDGEDASGAGRRGCTGGHERQWQE